MKKIIAFTVFLGFLFSCQPENRVYSEHQDLSPNLQWKKEDIKTFIVPISDNSSDYSIIVSFRYVDGFQYKDALITMESVSPSGIKESKEYQLHVIIDENYVGEPGLDIWDLDQVIENSFSFSETGNYTFTITHNMAKDPMNNVMEIGLNIDKNV